MQNSKKGELIYGFYRINEVKMVPEEYKISFKTIKFHSL